MTLWRKSERELLANYVANYITGFSTANQFSELGPKQMNELPFRYLGWSILVINMSKRVILMNGLQDIAFFRHISIW